MDGARVGGEKYLDRGWERVRSCATGFSGGFHVNPRIPPMRPGIKLRKNPPPTVARLIIDRIIPTIDRVLTLPGSPLLSFNATIIINKPM
jgi:hypothetical protein